MLERKNLPSPLKSELSRKAHQLHPVVIIGNKGLTEPVHKEVAVALKAHHLVKIRINAPTRDERQDIIQALTEQHQAFLIQKIGHIAVIYQPPE